MSERLMKHPVQPYQKHKRHYVSAYFWEELVDAFDEWEDWDDLGNRLVDGASETMNNMFGWVNIFDFSKFGYAVSFDYQTLSPVRVEVNADSIHVTGTLPTPVGTFKAKVSTGR